MANIKFGDFHKPYQYEQQKKNERKNSRNVRDNRKNKCSRWLEKE